MASVVELLNDDSEVIVTLKNINNPVAMMPIWKKKFGATSFRTPVETHDRETKLADVIAKALDGIDVIAGQVRSKYLTIVPGQDSTYVQKQFDAQRFIDAGEPADAEASYAWVAAEARATNESMSTAAHAIVDKSREWTLLGAAIEQARIGGKVRCSQATSVAEVQQIKEETFSTLQAM